MSDDDIDLDRVVMDPSYRRRVIEFLNTSVGDDRAAGSRPAGETGTASPPS